MHSNSEFDKHLSRGANELGVEISPQQIEIMRAHWRLMCTANEQTNLTRIIGAEDSAILHYVDSLALMLWKGRTDTGHCYLLDIGTGAGFPALPLATALSSWHITAIDGRHRKVEFVEAAATELKLTNLEALHERSEHWQADRVYSIVTTRALGAPAKAITLSEPHLSKDGVIALYVVDRDGNELDAEAKRVMKSQRLRLMDRIPYELNKQGENYRRAIVLVGRK